MISLLLRRFRKDTGAVAAIEFVLIFPILILLLLGTVEITHAVIAHKKVQKIAYTVDNLLTKAPAVNKKAVLDTLKASSYLINTFSGTLAIDVFYQYKNLSGTVTERWTQGVRGEGQKAESSRPLPKAYEEMRDTSFLTTYVRYTHKAAFPSLFFKEFTMTAESTVRPRLGASLSCADC